MKASAGIGFKGPASKSAVLTLVAGYDATGAASFRRQGTLVSRPDRHFGTEGVC